MDWWNLVRRSFLINTTTKKQVVAGARVLYPVHCSGGGQHWPPIGQWSAHTGPPLAACGRGWPGGMLGVHKSVCSIPRGRVAGAAAAWLLVLDTNL